MNKNNDHEREVTINMDCSSLLSESECVRKTAEKKRRIIVIAVATVFVAATVAIGWLMYSNSEEKPSGSVKQDESAVREEAEKEKANAKKNAEEVIGLLMDEFKAGNLTQESYNSYFSENAGAESSFNDWIESLKMDDRADKLLSGAKEILDYVEKEKIQEWKNLINKKALDMTSYEITQTKVSDNAETVTVFVEVICTDKNSIKQPSEKTVMTFFEEIIGAKPTDYDKLLEIWRKKEGLSKTGFVLKYATAGTDKIIKSVVKTFSKEIDELAEKIIDNAFSSAKTVTVNKVFTLEKNESGKWKIVKME